MMSRSERQVGVAQRQSDGGAADQVAERYRQDVAEGCLQRAAARSFHLSALQ
jgi:hypothetical protein